MKSVPAQLTRLSRQQIVQALIEFSSFNAKQQENLSLNMDKKALFNMLLAGVDNDEIPLKDLLARIRKSSFHRAASKHPKSPIRGNLERPGLKLPGLTARQMARSTPEKIWNNAKKVRVTSLKRRVSKKTGRHALVATTTEPSHATEEQPHKQLVEIVFPSGEKDIYEKGVRLKVSCDCSYFLYYCIAEGSLISTNKGLVPIEKIKDGDMVLDRNGDPVKVVAAIENGVKEVLSLKTVSGRSLNLTADHKILVWNKKKHVFQWKQAKDVQTLSKNIVLPTHGGGAAKDMRLDTLLNKHPNGKMRVYDLVLPQDSTHSFVANGFIVHNCEVPLAKHKAADIIYSNGAWPRQTNPTGIPWVCKHLIAIFKSLQRRVPRRRYRKVA